MEELNYMLHKAINDNIDVHKDRHYLRSAATVFSSVCGLCLEAEGDLQATDQQLSETVNILLGVPIPANDPTWLVCQPCMSNLKLFHGFREKCTANHQAMQKLKQYVVDLPESDIGAYELPMFMEFKLDESIIAEEIEVETQSKEGGFELEWLVKEQPEADKDELLVIDKKAICKICGHGVQGRSKLERHMKTHDPGYKGRRVVPVQKTIPVLEIAVLPTVDDESPNCGIKVERMPEADNVAETFEMKAVSPPKKNIKNTKKSICSVCGHAVEGQKKLDRHMRTHEPGFTRRKVVPVPNSVAAEDKPITKRIANNKYTCPVCGRMVESPNKLKRHMPAHMRTVKREPEEVEASTCPTCLCEFPSAEMMNKHFADHETLKNKPRKSRGAYDKPKLATEPHLCYICGNYRATRLSDMRIHIMRHRGEKPYKCDFCEKGFVSANALRSHRRQHTGEKPYKCRYCPRLYSDHTARKEHERRTHTFERPFPCTFCDKAFVCARVLKHHLTTHTGEKNYECTTCGMLFNKAWNLKAHQNVHLREQGKQPVYVRNRNKPNRANPISRVKTVRQSTASESESE